MDADEFLALAVSFIIAAAGGGRWYASLIRITRLGLSARERVALGLLPLLCIALVQGILACCAAREVQDAAVYDVLFVLGGAACLTLAGLAMHAVGISPRHDALERRNGAAAIAVCGGWVGATLCYAGANVGEGATIWMTFIPAAAASGVLFGMLICMQLLSYASDSISIDRDPASALRLAGLLIAAGLVLGRAVAGDFHSWDATWNDFLRMGWPVVPLLVATILLQWILRPRPTRPEAPVLCAGLLPAMIMMLSAAVDAWAWGLPSHCRKGG